MSTHDIPGLINRADQLSKEGRANDAEKLYRFVLNLIESDPASNELAQDLRAKIKQLALHGQNGNAQHGYTDAFYPSTEQVGSLARPATTWASERALGNPQNYQSLIDLYHKATNDVHALVYSFRMKDIPSNIQIYGKNPEDLFAAHLANVRAHLINNAQAELKKCEALQQQASISAELYDQVSTGFQKALAILRGEELEFPNDIQSHELNFFKDEFAIDDKIGQCDDLIRSELERFQARYFAQQQPPAASADVQRAEQIGLDPPISSIPEPESVLTPEPAPEPLPVFIDPIPEDEHTSMIDSLTQTNDQTAQELIAQAESYLFQRTSQNYKEAERLLKQALSLDGISQNLRLAIEQQLEKVAAERDILLGLDGELRTARQLANIENELVILLTMMDLGRETDDSGTSIVESFGAGLDKLSKKLLSTAEESLSVAGRQMELACNKLNLGALQAARDLIKEVQKLLNGQSIIENQQRDTALIKPERQAAIQNLAKSVEEGLRNSKPLSDYKLYLDEIEDIQLVLDDARPFHLKALEYYEKNDYRLAWSNAAQLNEIIAGQFSSQEAERIYAASFKAYENELVARLKLIEQKTKSAFENRQFAQVETYVAESFMLDAQFKSTQVDELFKTIRDYQNRADGINKQVKDVVLQGRELLHKGQLVQAAEKANEALRYNPNHKDAQLFEQQVFAAELDKQLNEIEAVLARKEASRGLLEKQLQTLQQTRSQSDSISDKASKQLFQERIEKLESRCKAKIEAHDQAEQQAASFERLFAEIERHIAGDEFNHAYEKLRSAESLKENDLARSNRLGELEQKLKTRLDRLASETLEANPPDPNRALLLIGLTDKFDFTSPESQALRSRAEQIKHRLVGIAAFEQGRFKSACSSLEQADLDRPETLEYLQKARRMLARQLFDEKNWQELLVHLDTIGSLDSELQEMKRDAQLEVSLEQVKQHLVEKEFNACENALIQAENNGPNDPRCHELREELIKARNLFNQVAALVQQATALYSSYKLTDHREELLKAIQILDQALALEGLTPDDKQAVEVWSQRNDYRLEYDKLIAGIRAGLLRGAESAFAQDDIKLALETFRKVLELMPSGRDADAEKGIERSLERLRELRNRLVHEIETMLNLRQRGQRGIELASILALNKRANELLAIESQIQHEDLRRALVNLEDAQRISQEAERSLQGIMKQWAELRSEPVKDGKVNSDKNDRIIVAIQHAASLFDLKTYTHIDLDHNNSDRLLERIKRDLETVEKSSKLYQDLQAELKQEQLNDTQIIGIFDRLRNLEVHFADTTSKLVAEGGIAPQFLANHSQHPYQTQSKQALLHEIEQIRGKEQQAPDLDSLERLIGRRNRFEDLLKRLISSGHFAQAQSDELAEKDGPNKLSIETVMAWSKDADKGSIYLKEAQQQERDGREKAALKLLREAIDQLEQAKQNYQHSIKLLEPISRIQTNYFAVKQIVDKANGELQNAQRALDSFTKEALIESCEERIYKAQLLYQQAQQDLEQGNYAEVRSRCDEAEQLDPKLSEQLDELRRASGSGQQNERAFGPLIVIVLVLVALVALGMLFGSSIWAWFSEVLFH